MWHARHIEGRVVEALADTPVVVLHGARQTGKSALARRLVDIGRFRTYATLDDATVLSTALRDPDGLLANLALPAVIDEVQMAPDLFRAIKVVVDRQRRPGMFLLTGSADVTHLPRIAESLAGRVEVIPLAPLSQGELAGQREWFVDALFGEADLRDLRPQPMTAAQLVPRIVRGGYPDVVSRALPARRTAWFEAYVSTLLQRDIRQWAEIQGIGDVPRLLGLLAGQHGGLVNVANLSRELGYSQPTLHRYLSLLRAAWLYQPLPAWAGNVRKRLIRADRAFLIDTGLLAWLLGAEAERIEPASTLFGTLLEAFVVQEVRRQIPWSQIRPDAFYYRTAAGREVDLVLESRRGYIVGIEVKASVTLGDAEVRGLLDLKEAVGSRFKAGAVVHPGREVVPLGDRLWAVPVGAIWSGAIRSGS